ncbi:MAG: hypothetical protein OQK75_04880 [Gammaproteobacteria bacterium]|nr:hypothetical protein [Gammaproteobacteria bacterium]MCW8986988.1 hypothetical protein [Gammaproteobacteria bacterium]MCW9032019.1 hypothetical protein [Gammaproteobacteria bacterium]
MNLVVKTHRPWKSKFIWGLVTLVLLISGWTLFDYGRYLAGYDSREASNEIEGLLQVQAHLEKRIEALREDKAVLERAAQIERKAYNELDTTLKILQAEILEHKEELAFYRGIVSPKDSSSGLYLQNFFLNQNGETRSYRYKVVLTQVLKNSRLVNGKVKLQFDGLLNGESKTLELKDVTAKKVRDLNYRFKYFQNVEGVVEFPEEFSLLRVIVQILPRGSESDMIEKTIEWSIEEK